MGCGQVDEAQQLVVTTKEEQRKQLGQDTWKPCQKQNDWILGNRGELKDGVIWYKYQVFLLLLTT